MLQSFLSLAPPVGSPHPEHSKAQRVPMSCFRPFLHSEERSCAAPKWRVLCRNQRLPERSPPAARLLEADRSYHEEFDLCAFTYISMHNY